MKQTFFRFTIVLLLGCLMATNAWAAKKIDLVSANSAGYIQKMNSQVDHGRSAMNAIFGLTANEKFTRIRESVDFNSMSHTRYQQSYKGIPIWGMETIVSRDHTDEVIRINGAVALDIPKDILNIPGTLDPQGALARMEKQHKAKDARAVWNFSNEKYGTYIYVDKKNKAKLCYMVSFFADNEKGNPSRPLIFIDVKSGKVIDSYNVLMKYGQGTGPGGNLKIGQYEYGTDFPPFDVTVNGSTCTMITTNVKTVDLNHGTSGSTPFSYPCYRNTHENINGGYCPMNDAQFFGQQVFYMYMNYTGLELPFQLTLKCHYSTNYEGYFWNGLSIVIGDGNIIYYPAVCLQVIAHECSHGFTEYNSGLIYSGQSGGINESFSDMGGEAAKYYMRGTNNFLCSENEILKGTDPDPKYMYDPPLDGHSIDHISEYIPGMDPHSSSGLFNKPFYLIATSAGWTTRMAFEIFARANMYYWTPSTSFQQGAECVLWSAQDYDYPTSDVINAFEAVGINIGGYEMYVSDIKQTITKMYIGKIPYFQSTAVVTMLDTRRRPVSNATVYIDWKGAENGSASGITNLNGTVSFITHWVPKPGPFTITVTNATHYFFPYNPALNIETSDTAYYQ